MNMENQYDQDLFPLSDPDTDPFLCFLRAIGPLAGGLPLRELLPGEGQRLGGYLFSDAPMLVIRLAQALRDNPELFGDLGRWKAELAKMQRRAFGAQQGEIYVRRLADALRRTYVKEQGEAVKLVLKILDDIERSDREFFASLTPAQRSDREFVKQHIFPRLLRDNALWPVRLTLWRLKVRKLPKLKTRGPRKRSTAYDWEVARRSIEEAFRGDLKR